MRKKSVLTVAFLLILLVSGCGKTVPDGIFYIKDSGLYYTNTSAANDLPKQLEEKDGNTVIDSTEYHYYIERSAYLNAEDKIFYPTNICPDRWSLMCCDRLGKNQKEIDTNITAQAISKDGTIVTYVKNNMLYQHQSERTELIHNFVESGFGICNVAVSDDGKILVYLDQNNELFLKIGKEPEEKIDENVTHFYVSENFSNIYYIKGDDLYQKKKGVDKKIISQNVKKVLHVYESGKLYFLQTTEYDSNIDDYIEDDLLNDLSTNDIKNEMIKRQEHTLYYWNGTKIQKVGETATIIFDVSNGSSGFKPEALNYQCAEKEPVMIYEAYYFDEMHKIKLSELPYVSKKQIISAIESEFQATGKMTLVTENETQNVKQIQVDPLFGSQNICISPKGDEIFYVEDVTVYEGDGNINRIEILDGTVQMPKFYDNISYTNYVLCNSMLFTQNGSAIYMKNYKRDCDLGNLCIDQNLIASNVKNDTVKVYGNGEMIGFIENWDSGNGQGTLQLYVDEGKKELAIDVHEYEILSTDCIVYLQDYDMNTGKGNLYIYKNGVVEKIDDNVEGIIDGMKNIEYGINQKSRSFG